MQTAIFLYNKDIQRLTGKGRSSAWRYMNYIRSVVGKSKSQQITIYDLVKVEGLSLQELHHALSQKGPGSQLNLF